MKEKKTHIPINFKESKYLTKTPGFIIKMKISIGFMEVQGEIATFSS